MTIPLFDLKSCRTCKQELTSASFHKNARFADGLNSECAECAKARSLAWRERHRSECTERTRQYRKRKKAERDAEHAKYLEENKDRLAAEAAAKRAEQKRKKSEYDRRYYIQNAEKKARYRDENRHRWIEQKKAYYEKHYAENRKAYVERAKARHLKVKGVTVVPFTVEQLEARMAYFGNVCWICQEAPFEHVDHVKPISKGGLHVLANLRPACELCNLRKRNQWPFDLDRFRKRYVA